MKQTTRDLNQNSKTIFLNHVFGHFKTQILITHFKRKNHKLNSNKTKHIKICGDIPQAVLKEKFIAGISGRKTDMNQLSKSPI